MPSDISYCIALIKSSVMCIQVHLSRMIVVSASSIRGNGRGLFHIMTLVLFLLTSAFSDYLLPCGLVLSEQDGEISPGEREGTRLGNGDTYK